LEAREWAGIRNGRNPAAIEAFLQKHPESPRRAEAQQLLAQLEWDALDRKDRAAVERFVARHKNSPLASQAQAELARMEREAAAAAQKKQEERLASERAEIEKTFAIFATAFERKDLELLRSVWPKPDQEAALAQAFRSRGEEIRQQLRPIGPIDVAGDNATVRCMRIIQQVGQFGAQKPVEQPKTVRLRKENGRWVIDAIQ
jgi:hypothetical protein